MRALYLASVHHLCVAERRLFSHSLSGTMAISETTLKELNELSFYPVQWGGKKRFVVASWLC